MLLLRYTTDARRGADSAALQLADATCSALTTGVGGVLVAAAARGVLGYTGAFTIVDLTMVALAAIGAAAAGRARPPADPRGRVHLLLGIRLNRTFWHLKKRDSWWFCRAGARRILLRGSRSVGC